MSRSIVVVGAGAWGTALAIILAGNNQPTQLWARDPAHRNALKTERRNRRYLPDAGFPNPLSIADSLESALDTCEAVVLAVPAAATRDLLERIGRHARPRKLCLTGKGLDPMTRDLLSTVARRCLDDDAEVAALSGPSFAQEVAAGLPTAVTIAADTLATASWFAGKFHNATFRTYTHDDLIGVQIGGAVKNVIAIAAGIADGLGLGANTRAALITRGLTETMRIGDAFGGRRETLMGLTGIGDLILSCTDDQSRNRQFGLALATHATVSAARRHIQHTVEGIETARVMSALADKHAIEMPIAAAVRRIVDGECTPRDAVRALLAREPRREMD